MVTRVYFDTWLTTKNVTPSSWLAGWDASSGSLRSLCLSKDIHQSGVANDSTTGTGVSGQSKGATRWLLGPLATQTISGTVKGQTKVAQTNTTDNYTSAFGIKVLKPDGTDRGVLLAVSASDDTSATPPECVAGVKTNRRFLNSVESASLTLSSVDAVLGDYLLIERGFRQASTSVASFLYDYGFLSSYTELPEDDTTTTISATSWVEFSQTIAVAGEYFGSTATPADSATATGTADPTAVTPPAGMLAGDLVCMVGEARIASLTLAISQAGGQTWTSHTAIGKTTNTTRLFTCTFNGTWSADPSVSFGSATCNSVHMHVFRPPATDYTWSVNQALVELDIAAAPHTITGQTTTGTDPTVTLAGWFTSDDNTWGTLVGTGWEATGIAQYRNVSGSDQSATYAHKIQTAAGATGNVTQTQLTLGDDASTTFIVTMQADAPIQPRRLPVNRSFAVDRAARY